MHFVTQLKFQLEQAAAVPNPSLIQQRQSYLVRLWLNIMHTHRTPHVVVSFATIIALVIAITITLFYSSSQSVRAAEIMARVDRANQGLYVPQLRSYKGTAIIRDRIAATLIAKAAGHQQDLSAVQPLQTQVQVWVQAPAKVRTEIRPISSQTGASPLPLHAGQQNDQQTTLVTDGSVAWRYYPTSQRVERVDVATVASTNLGVGADSLSTLLKDLAGKYNVTIMGDDTVVGRATYVLKLVPKESATAAQSVASVTLWIDKEVYLQLRGEAYDAQGNMVIDWHFSSLELNPALDTTLFNFVVPAGVTVVDARRQATQSITPSLDPWQQVARQANYTVCKPAYVPETLTAGWPSYDQGAVIQNYHTTNNPSAVVIIETLPSVVKGGPHGQQIQIGNLSGFYYKHDDQQILTFVCDGTRIELQASVNFAKDELVKIAASMQAVSKASTADSSK